MLSHVQLNVSDLERSVRFYLSVLEPLGFHRADERPGQYVRISNGRDAVLVLCPAAPAYRGYSYHRKAVGLGHLALAADSRAAVDGMQAHLAALGVPLLGLGLVDSAYRGGYYTLSFEDPDRIMIEVVHCDPRYYSLDPP